MQILFWTKKKNKAKDAFSADIGDDRRCRFVGRTEALIEPHYHKAGNGHQPVALALTGALGHRRSHVRSWAELQSLIRIKVAVDGRTVTGSDGATKPKDSSWAGIMILPGTLSRMATVKLGSYLRLKLEVPAMG
jgi:hypothetical protein